MSIDDRALHIVPPRTDGTPPDEYVPGVCNIGPWEIRRRRAFALAGFVVAGIVFGLLVASGVPAVTRLVLLVPLTGGAFSWLQARRRFCAAFAMSGIANFGDDEAGRRRVQDHEARRQDVAAVRRMTRDAILIALPIAIVAVLLPV